MTPLLCPKCEIFNRAAIESGYAGGMCGDCYDKGFVSFVDQLSNCLNWCNPTTYQQKPTSLLQPEQPNAGTETSASTCGSADCCSSTTSDAFPCV